MACGYCDRETNYIYQTRIADLKIEKIGSPFLQFKYKGDVQDFGLAIQISFCPMCGERLQSEYMGGTDER